MHLINTIEVSPYNFSNEEYKYPNGSSVDYPERVESILEKMHIR